MYEKTFCVFRSKDEKSYIVFINPVKIISAQNLANIKSNFTDIQNAIDNGFFAAGFLSYECGYAFNDYFDYNLNTNFPYSWFGVFKDKIKINELEELWNINTIRETFCGNHFYKYSNQKYNLKKDDYIKKINKIKELIAAGTVYQINFSVKNRFDFHGNPLFLFFDLVRRQNTNYAAFIHINDYSILSLSPELFFEKNNYKLTAKPMKGTIKRGANQDEDNERYYNLLNSDKNRAENLMIVDLLRNDMGKVSEFSSVKVESLFDIEKYESVFQMTSQISSELKKETGLYDLFDSLFPCGSVTGAPKIKAMEKIKELEKYNRNIFCGSIGYFTPDNKALFNVAIRTLLINNDNGKGELFLGSGIVWDSNAEEEFDECMLKGEFFTENKFYLIETMLYKSIQKEIFLLDLHLKRLQNSAENFKYTLDLTEIKNLLKKKISNLKDDKKIRLLLFYDGKVEIEVHDLLNIDKKCNVCFSKIRTNKNNAFLYYKTSMRHLYNNELQRAKSEGYYDVIFLNSEGCVTESSFNNVLIEKSGIYYTPFVNDGLLNGVYRQHLLSSKKFLVEEKHLTKSDLLNADKVYLMNSVRGKYEVNVKNLEI